VEVYVIFQAIQERSGGTKKEWADMLELTNTQKRKAHALWDSLKPLQRTKVFCLKKTCLFVFHTWNELRPEHKEIAYKGLREAIARCIVNDEVKKMLVELVRLGKKNMPERFKNVNVLSSRETKEDLVDAIHSAGLKLKGEWMREIIKQMALHTGVPDLLGDIANGFERAEQAATNDRQRKMLRDIATGIYALRNGAIDSER
jgi:hypothetical protein